MTLLGTIEYLSFPSTMQTEQHYHSTLFPKITLCMNSIHSRKRLQRLNISEDIIRSYYGYNNNKNITYPNITFSETFFTDTSPGN